MKPEHQSRAWKLMTEPTVAIALSSAVAYFVAIQYWNSYLRALGVEPSLFDPSVARLLSFSFNGIVGAVCFLAANEYLYRIRRVRSYVIALVLWVAVAEVIYLYPEPSLAGMLMPLLFVAGPVINRRNAPRLRDALNQLVEVRTKLEQIRKRADTRAQQISEERARAFVGGPILTDDEPSRGDNAEFIGRELLDLDAEVAKLERDYGASELDVRLYRWRHGVLLAVLFACYTYSVAPAVARFSVAVDVAGARWSSKSGVESPLVTDGSTLVTVRPLPCAVLVSTESTRFIRECPALVKRHLRREVNDEHILHEVLELRHQMRRKALLEALSQADGGANDGGANDGGPNDAGANDAGANDGGPNDGGANDGGPNDAGANDAGANDAGANDIGANDIGANDAGANDAGANDA